MNDIDAVLHLSPALDAIKAGYAHTMRVVNEEPPNIAAIDKVFNIRGKAVLYAYGDVIYNPLNYDIPPAVVEHERVHGARQSVIGVEQWWEFYLDNPAFRLEEELLAHVCEYAHMLRGNRHARRAALKHVAFKLSSPLYGSMIRQKTAGEKIRKHFKSAQRAVDAETDVMDRAFRETFNKGQDHADEK